MSEEIARALTRSLALDPQIWSTPDRLRAVLMDLCPGKQAQRRVLVAAAEEGIVAALSRLGTSVWSTPFPPQVRSLSLRLQARTGIDPGFADWAVRQWSTALGLGSGLDLREPSVTAPEPGAAESPAIPPLKATRTARAPALTAVVRGSSPPAVASPHPAPGRVLPPPSRTPPIQRILGLAAAVVLPLLGGGLYMWMRPDVQLSSPPVQAGAGVVVPATWWTYPGNVQRLETTFVGTWEHPGGNREALFLQIHSFHVQHGRGLFQYTLNAQGLRFNNLGTLQEGKLSIPDLGTAEVFHERGDLLLRGSGTSSQGNWELRATTL